LCFFKYLALKIFNLPLVTFSFKYLVLKIFTLVLPTVLKYLVLKILTLILLTFSFKYLMPKLYLGVGDLFKVPCDKTSYLDFAKP
jgi:hypothetical protein